MAPANDIQEIEAERLARARQMAQHILREWDLTTWDQLLAENGVLSLRLDGSGAEQFCARRAVAENLQAWGRDDAKRLLKNIYRDLKIGLSITAEIISGRDVALLGRFAESSTKENAESVSFPVALYLGFGDEGRIEEMTIAAIDLHAAVEALWIAA